MSAYPGPGTVGRKPPYACPEPEMRSFDAPGPPPPAGCHITVVPRAEFSMKSCSCTIQPSGLPPTRLGCDARLRDTCSSCARTPASSALIRSIISSATPDARTAATSARLSAESTRVSCSRFVKSVRAAAAAGSRAVQGNTVASFALSAIAASAGPARRW